MDMKTQIKAALVEAQLRQFELAAACGVTRQTIIRYLRDAPAGTKPKIEGRVRKTVAVIRQLVTNGKLPLAEDTTREKRADAMERIRTFVARSEQ